MNHPIKQKWLLFRKTFPRMVDTYFPSHSLILNNLLKDGLQGSSNMLFYGCYGFPLEYFAELFVQRSLNSLSASQLSFENTNHTHVPHIVWNQKIPYRATESYFIVDLRHPDMPKDLACFPEFVKCILESSCIHMERHIFLLYNVDVICSSQNHYAMRVLLERFSHNALFIGTTYKLGRIEPPIRSRFMMIRVPLPSEEECATAAAATVTPVVTIAPSPHNREDCKTRNLLHTISDTTTNNLNYPPLKDFMQPQTQQAKAPRPSIVEIRQMAYKLFQAHITLPMLAMDLIQLIRPKSIQPFLEKAHVIEAMYNQSSKCRETLYLELMLHYAFIL